jgi:hypothetical protein
MLYLKHHVAVGRYAMSMPFRMVLIATLMIMSSGAGAGGGSSEKRKKKNNKKKKRAERDRFVLRNTIAIGPTGAGKTTVMMHLLFHAAFGNLRRYQNILIISKHCSGSIAWEYRDPFIRLLSQMVIPGVNIVCSCAGWNSTDERPKVDNLKKLLYATYQGDTLIFWDDWPDLCTNERTGPREPTTLLKTFVIQWIAVDARKRNMTNWLTLQANRELMLPKKCRDAFRSYLLFTTCDADSLQLASKVGVIASMLDKPLSDLKYMRKHYLHGEEHNFILVNGGETVPKFHVNAFSYRINHNHLGKDPIRYKKVPGQVYTAKQLIRYCQKVLKVSRIRVWCFRLHLLICVCDCLSDTTREPCRTARHRQPECQRQRRQQRERRRELRPHLQRGADRGGAQCRRHGGRQFCVV